MQYTRLGRTGLNVSRMGVGGGGPSRLGQRVGIPEADSTAILRTALDQGVNFVDTAEAYGTEEIVGQAIKGRPRDQLVISTKKSTGQGSLTAQDLRAGLEASLKRLDTDYVDVYHLHGVRIDHYDHLYAEVVPEMLKLRDEGKIRYLGITEAWNSDLEHQTLIRALHDDVWDVMMVGFNLLNQTAREMVLKATIEKNIGVLIMFAVRLALSKPERLQEILPELIEKDEIDPAELDMGNPLGFLTQESDAADVVDAAYRYCIYEPGVHVTLSGTGNIKHMQANLASFDRPALPEALVQKINHVFRNVRSTSAQ